MSVHHLLGTRDPWIASKRRCNHHNLIHLFDLGGSRSLLIFVFKLGKQFPTLANLGIQELIYYSVIKKYVLNRENEMWHYDKNIIMDVRGEMT